MNRIEQMRMENKFKSYRAGFMDAVSCRVITETSYPEWHSRGWKDGKDLLRERLNAIRAEIGLPPENIVRLAG